MSRPREKFRGNSRRGATNLFLELKSRYPDFLKHPVGNAWKYFDLGETFVASEKFNDAVVHFKKAKEINSKIGSQYMEALTSERLGSCSLELGRYEEALAFAHDGIAIFDKIGEDVGKFGKANGYSTLGGIYGHLGRYSEAIDYQKKALKVYQEMSEDNHAAIAWSNLGDFYNLNEEHEEAIKCCKKALEISTKTGQKAEQGSSQHNLANSFYALRKFDEAIKYCEKSIAIFTSNDAKSRRDVSSSYIVLANCHRGLGHSKKALYYYEKSIEMKKELQRYTEMATASGNLGLLYIAMANNPSQAKKCHKSIHQCYENSIEYLKSAIRITNEQFLALSVDENKTSFVDRFYHWHVKLLRPFFSIGRIEAALLVLDLGKAKALQMMIEKRTKPSKAAPHDRSGCKHQNESWLSVESGKEEERLVDLSREIQLKQSDCTVLIYTFDMYSLLVIWVLNMDGTINCPLYGVSSETALEEHISSILERVSLFMPRGYSFFSQASSSNERPCEQEKTKNENLDVEKATNDTPKQTKISARRKTVSTSNSSSQVTHQATASNYTDGLLDNSQPDVTKATETQTRRPVPAQTSSDTLTDEDSSRLYQALISPVKEFIKGKKLIIVPHGCLFFAPFSSLIDEHGCYLSEKYQIQVIPSVHTLATSMKSLHSSNIGTSLFVGNPKVGKVSYKGKEMVPYPLPSAIKEVESLASLLGAKAIVEAEATKERVIRLMRNATIIHIAAHGEEGTILLAPNSSRKAVLPTEESYLLTQRDVLGCELSARLVVLSCCYTGRGAITSEGVLGIARSFLGAGARSVLVTLWKIHDDATREFMEHFYNDVCEGTSVCEALKKTMNMFQQHEQYKSFSYWAPFEIFGEDVKFSQKEIEEMRIRNSKPLK